jgi:hypothetical protein
MQPKISVSLMIGMQRERAGRSLESVLAQDGIEGAEVLLFDLFSDEFPPLPGSNHPSVRLIPIKEELTHSELRAYAAGIARGEIIAYVEDHVIVVPGWLSVLLKDFALGYAGVGGVPGILNPGAGISDAVSMMNYLPWLRVNQPTEFYSLPGHNSAYRRDVLLSLGDELATLLSSEFLLGLQLKGRGHKMLVDPAAQFMHVNEQRLRMIALGYYYWNLIFGRSRAHIYHWSWIRRIAQALAIPLVPFVRLFKILVFLEKNDRATLPLFFRSIGVILVANTSAAVGIAQGCLLGAGDAGFKFRDYELNDPRTGE